MSFNSLFYNFFAFVFIIWYNRGIVKRKGGMNMAKVEIVDLKSYKD